MNRVTRELLCLIIVLANFGLSSCGCQNTSNRRSQVDDAVIDASLYTVTNEVAASETAEDKIGKTLNDIRFEGWGKEQWIDNEYIRTVRKYIDAYNNGEIEDASLDEYKDYIKGKFIIDQIQPWMQGGALIHFTFCNHPEKMFYAIVYSSVNVQTREVYDYECRGIRWETAAPETTKDEMIQFLKEHPEYKMW